MDDKNNSNHESEMDFTSSPSFQKSIKKAKWKQVILYTIISIITMGVCIVLIHGGSQYLINKKLQKGESQQVQRIKGEYTQGAAISSINTRYHHNLFSIVAETTYYKKIGNRPIVWDTVTKKYPAIGSVEVVDRGSGMTKVNEIDGGAQRVVRYNQLNNERIIDFYFPGLSYDYLPQELEIATGLDENT